MVVKRGEGDFTQVYRPCKLSEVVGIGLWRETKQTFSRGVQTLSHRLIVALRHTDGNRSMAAKKMKIQRTYLSRLIAKFAISYE
jgi:DNA-binding NtrC family response regulator